MSGHAGERPAHALVADLERTLGDPAAESGPFSFAEIVAHEENDSLPPGAVELLRSWGFSGYLVPEEFGGGSGTSKTSSCSPVRSRAAT
ncbi:hypothetical protein ACN24K_00095 [Streptomyces microflavus]